MGGNAFPTLRVPRLKPEEYNEVLARTLGILKQFYSHVSVAPEAPGKPDYGDIDILVSEPYEESSKPPSDATSDSTTTTYNAISSKARKELIIKSLNAVQSTKLGVTTSFAVPHPTFPDTYAQVDTHECLPGRVAWEAWMGGYGDMTQILGVLNRPLGLTMNDLGLFVRVKEVEKNNRKASMVMLTNTPEGVCEFLGLDRKQWLDGFETEEEIFKWCAKGKFYGRVWNKGEKGESSLNISEDKQDGKSTVDEAGFSGEDKTAAEGGTVTTNDRARMRTRPMFKRFFREWLPENPDAFGNEWPVERQQVLDTGLDQFGVRPKYDEIMSKYWEEERQKSVLEELQAVIPLTGDKMKEAIRGIKRWTKLEDGKPVIREEDDPGNTMEVEWLWKMEPVTFKKFLQWVAVNYKDLRSMEKNRAKSFTAGLGAMKITSN
jgi:hypothetical protein